jgi:hypothetical protein
MLYFEHTAQMEWLVQMNLSRVVLFEIHLDTC